VLIVDQTGVGVSVVQQLRRANLPIRHLTGICITGGRVVTKKSDGDFNCPKIQIASALQSVLQSRRLLVSPALAEAPTLKRELATFAVRINPVTMNESFEAWRSAAHDDTVLAVGLAVWYGQHAGRRIVLGL
jgi:hypothetical protein